MNDIKFTLIHGTFSANAEWVNHDENKHSGSFRARLSDRFKRPVSFSIPPAWGSQGLLKLKDLTNSARLSGAENLRAHILTQEPAQGNFLVAHSHGGNVAMYALQDKAAAEKVDGLICLATPFLYPRARPLSIMALLLSLAVMLVGILQYINGANLMKGDALAWLSAVSMIVFGFIVPAGLTWLVAYERYRIKYKNDSELPKLVERLSYQNPNVPVLLIRASGDEASGLLGGAQFLNWLGGIGMRLGGQQLYLLVCAIALTLTWAAYRDAETGAADLIPSFVLPLLSQGITLSAAIMVILLMALTLSRVFVGFDSWRWVGEIETMVEDGPPGITSDLVVIKPKSGHQLSHTNIYHEPETIDTIYQWCRSQLNHIGSTPES